MKADGRNQRHIETPLRVFQGANCLARMGAELKRLDCRRAVVICGSTLAQSGALNRLRDGMGGRFAGIFDGARPHAAVPSVLAAAEALRAAQADAVIAVGGGSAIVTARAATILFAEGGDLSAVCTSRDERGRLHSPRLDAPKIPNFVVPTTPTAASVTAGTAVLDVEDNVRRTMFDPKARASAVFIDPDLAMTAPSELVQVAALDSMTLAAEGLLANAGDMFSDAYLSHSLRQLAGSLQDLTAGDEPERRMELLMAALLCGRGIEHTSMGITTVLGHSIGITCELPNGLVKSVLLPHVLRFNADFAPAGVRRLARALDVENANAPLTQILVRLEDLRRSLDTPDRLRDIGVPKGKMSEIVAKSMDDWFLQSNPRPIGDARQLSDLLQQAF